MGKDRKNAPAGVFGKIMKAMPLLLLVVGIAFVCLIGGLSAKYVATTSEGDNQIGAKDFYFTIDLLTDSEFSGDENTAVSRTVELYGAGQNSLNFAVQNYFDDLRVNSADIPYTISWTGDVTVERGGSAASGSDTLTGGAQTSHSFTLAFTNKEDTNTAVVTVASAAPYSKTMTLTIVYHPEQYDVLYRVEDAPGNAYANLIVMVGKAEGVSVDTLSIDWTAAPELRIDSADTDILLGDGGSGSLSSQDFADSIAQNTRALELDESISILFFKPDPTKDYSKADTVAPLENSKYQIVIEPNS